MSKPILSLIVAMTPQRVIGANNTMPWHLPADLAFFKATTWGAPIVMGRKTHQAIGKALPGRRNIVISQNPDCAAPGCEVVTSLSAALQRCAQVPEVFVIGGGTLYTCALPLAQRIYLTQIHGEVLGDTWFPECSATHWAVVSQTFRPQDERNAYDMTFMILERVPAVPA